MGAPIINVWCMNKVGLVHDMFFRLCLHIFHDIYVHGRITHQFHNYKNQTYKIKILFKTNTEILQKISPFLKYDITNPFSTPEQFKKTIILFVLLHEEFFSIITKSSDNFYNILDILNFIFTETNKFVYDKLLKKFNEEYNKGNVEDGNITMDEIKRLLSEIKKILIPEEPRQSNHFGGAKRNYHSKLSRKTKLAKNKKTVKTKSCTVSAKS
jgi:hypothetical protein